MVDILICHTQAQLVALIMSALHLGMPMSVVPVLWSLEWFPATPKWNNAFPAVANKNVCNEKDLHGKKEKVVPQQ